MSDPIEVLDFWLHDVGPDGWYAAGDALDADIKDRFHDLWIAARSGGLEHWNEGVAGSLAFIVLCDQFSRNMHRGTAEAFATDEQARAAARIAVAAGWDLDAPEPERQFFYMPFEHSEDPADQDMAVSLLTERLPSHPDMALHARAHREVISKFGRFPFRNAALGRESTELERQFLTDGGYAAVVAALRAQDKV
jgi:uncharacterized protein (DUF924 family)